MKKALIIDDETHCVHMMQNLLREHPTIAVCGYAGSVDEALASIAMHKPDILFLDIQLGGNTGFDLLDRLGHIDFDIIFTTAYSGFAQRAFRYSAVHYLLKPIDKQELNIAIDRTNNQQNLTQLSKQLHILRENLTSANPSHQKIAVPTSDGLMLINIAEIIKCEADSNYAYIYIYGRDKMIISKPLKYCEDLLPSTLFFRAHQSFLVNLDYVSQYYKGKGGYLKLRDGSKVPVAVRRKEELLQRLMEH